MLAAVVLAGGGAGWLRAQAPPDPQVPQGAPPAVTFKVEINYVEVDAFVVDDKGNPVQNLTKDDFQVLEDGKPQSVSAFARVDIPIERAERPLFATQPIEPDVRSNASRFDGRLYVIMLDDLHTSALRSALVKNAAKHFIERNLGANDLAAVVHTSGRTNASQDFTSNKRLLVAAVDKFMGDKLPSSTLNQIEEYQRRTAAGDTVGTGIGDADPLRDPDDFERGFKARQTFSSLKQVSEFLSGIRGRRKALLFISEGVDYDVYNILNQSYSTSATSVISDARDAIAAATRANVSIYGIDPRGLTAMGDDLIEMQGTPIQEGTLNLGVGSMQNELRLAQDSLRSLSEETGGFASVNTNNVAAAFDRVVQENSSYYVLGYYPTNEKRDGKFRKLEVKVRKPGLTVRSRKGYSAPRGNPKAPAKDTGPAPLFEAMNSPVPVGGLTMTVVAAPFKGTAPNASVLIGIEFVGRGLRLEEKDGKFSNQIEVSYVAIDPSGKSIGNRDTLNLTLRPETRERVVQYGMRSLNRLELPPGRYQVRVAGYETGGSQTGSVFYDLDVPDFYKAPLSMSGLLVTSAFASRMPTAKNDETLRGALPGPPTGLREFPQNDELALFAEVYDNEGATAHKLDIITTVTTNEGQVVFKTEEPHDTSEMQGARGGFGHTARVPLKDLAHGLYLLRVEARSRLGDSPSVSREVLFRVGPALAATR